MTNDSLPDPTLANGENLPKLESPANSRRWRTGILLAGGAVAGCFALALWNRKALSTLLRDRNQDVASESATVEDTDAIY
jgi:hypothetical protein